MFILLRSASFCMKGCCACTVWPCTTQLETPRICTLPRTLPGCSSCAIPLRNSEPCSLSEKRGEKKKIHQNKKSTIHVLREKVASVWPWFDVVEEKQEILLKRRETIEVLEHGRRKGGLVWVGLRCLCWGAACGQNCLKI